MISGVFVLVWNIIYIFAHALQNSPPAICAPGWHSFGGSCYWMVSNTDLLTTWYEAVTKCSDMGAHLLIINR